jgi:hypothetical protein
MQNPHGLTLWWSKTEMAYDELDWIMNVLEKNETQESDVHNIAGYEKEYRKQRYYVW